MNVNGEVKQFSEGQVPAGYAKLSEAEEELTRGLKPADAFETVLANRFRMWLEFSKQKPDGLSRARMKRAYEAGFITALDEPPNEQQAKAYILNLKKTEAQL